MKNIKTVATVTAILFFLSGCGGSAASNTELQNSGDIDTLNEEENQTNNSDIVLEFKTEGTYDLSSYIFPTLVTQKRFSVKTYIGDTDPTDTVYGNVTDTTFYTHTIEENDNQITFKKDGQIDLQYTLLDDRIQIENSTISNPVDIVRFSDIGDYIGTIDENITDSNIKCKLNSNLGLKNGFQDVLQIVCQNQNGLYKSEYFYAKNIGSILEVNSICTENISDDLNCTNIVTKFSIPN